MTGGPLLSEDFMRVYRLSTQRVQLLQSVILCISI